MPAAVPFYTRWLIAGPYVTLANITDFDRVQEALNALVGLVSLPVTTTNSKNHTPVPAAV